MHPGERSTPDEGARHVHEPEPPRTAIVTGASGPVGSVVARRMGEEGCELLLPTRGDPQALRRTFPRARVLRAALREDEGARAVAAAADEAWGGVDAVVHMTGGFALAPAARTGAARFEELLDSHLRAVASVTAATLPGMTRRGRGAIVAVSAAVARTGGSRMGAYAAAKAALEAYLRSVRAEVASSGIGVGIIVPEGTIDTPANRGAMPSADPRGWIAPEAVADAVWYLVTRPPRGRVPELHLAP